MSADVIRFWEANSRTRDEHPEWRRGQTAFNVLAALHPQLAERVRGTTLDPFHNEAQFPAFRDFINRELGDES